MTYQEAIKMLHIGLETAECKQKKEVYLMAINAFEKAIPKKPLWYRDGSYIQKACPNCGTDIPRTTYRYPHYCFHCGQALDWYQERREE